MAGVLLSDPAINDFLSLDGSEQKLVIKGMMKLEISPELRGDSLGRRSTSNLTGLRKLPVGRNKSIRIVYQVEPDGSASIIHVIAGRADEECYRLAAERIAQMGNGAIKTQLSEILETAWNI